jgi:hypothetical protein
MKPFAAVVCLVALLCGACSEQSGQADVEAWNEGVDLYRAGDVTNALAVLRPLMFTRSHGARAAELVAKLEYERGNQEEAAVAAQIALRANPSDERAIRNFTRAIDGLAEARETRRINDALKAAQGRDPGAIMLAATHESRRLMDEVAGIATNRPETVVALSDRLSARAEALSDMWIPVKEAICQSVTNEEQMSTIVLQVDKARARTRQAARQIADIEPEAYASLSDVEHDCTRFLKMTMLPPDAMDEGLVAQSNAWQDVEAFNGRSWQKDALDYTRSFRARFPAWALAYEQQAQADTNSPPFTADDQARVSALATELEKLQLGCVENPLPPDQERSLEIIDEIRGLLPKRSGGKGQGQNQPQQGEGEGQENRQDGDSGEADDVQAEEMEAVGEDEGSEAQDEPSEEEKAVDAILRKAQERNDEHEAEKKARMRKAPLPPNERDW